MKYLLLGLVMVLLLAACGSLTGNVITESSGISIIIPDENKFVVGDSIPCIITIEDDFSFTQITLSIQQQNQDLNKFAVNISDSGSHKLFVDVPENIEGNAQIVLTAVSGDQKVTDAADFIVIQSEDQLEQSSQDYLLDVSVDIPKEYRAIHPGDDILASIRLINHGGSERVDIFLKLWIVDSQNITVIETQETVAVETQANFVRSIPSKDLAVGEYSVYTQVVYADGKTAHAHKEFSIVPKDNWQPYALYGGLALIIIAIGVTAVSVMRSKGVFKRLAVKSKVDKIVKRRKLK